MTETKDAETLAEQGRHIAHNMAEVFDVSGQIWQKFLAAQMQDGAPKHPDPLNTWPTFAELYRTMWDNPKQVADMTIEFWSSQQQLWQNSMLKWLGAKEAVDDLQLPHMAKADKRFVAQGVERERGLRVPEAVLPADLGLDPGHGRLGRRHGSEGAQEGGVLHPLLRRGDEPGQLLRAEPGGAGGDRRAEGREPGPGPEDDAGGPGARQGQALDPADRHGGLRGRAEHRGQPGRGGLAERLPAAPAVRADDREGHGAAADDHPAVDQQVLHPRPQRQEEPGALAGRAGLHRLRDLLGQSRRPPRQGDLGGLHVPRAPAPPSTRCWRRPGRRA